MQQSNDILPVYTGVVRLKSYGKGEDVHHVCRTKRPHLFILIPDSIQLLTTADADEELPTFSQVAMDKTFSVVTRKMGPLSRIPRPHLLGHKNGGSGAASPEATENASDQASVAGSNYQEDPEELSEGQVFRLGVALNQVLAVEVLKQVRVKVYYQPNRPSNKGSLEDQTLMVLRGILRSVDPTKWKTGSDRKPLPHQNAHHFTIVAETHEEALFIKEEIERTQTQLALAVLWLSEGLPLRSTSSIVMMTVGPSSTNNGGTQSYALPYPKWDTELSLPTEVSAALANPTSRRSVATSVKVYLSTPLGPAMAEIPLVAVMRSAAEGSAPVTTTAVLQDPPENEVSKLRSGKKWRVLLQWKGVKGEPMLPPVTTTAAGGAIASGSNGSEVQELGGASPTSVSSHSREGGPFGGREHRELVTNRTATGAGGSMAVLVGLAALSGATAIARRVRNQWARLRGAGPITVPGAPQPWHRWKIAFIELDIEKETEQPSEAMPAVKRALSVSVPAHAGAPSGAALPHHIELLLQQYPGVITTDIARRFVVGLGSETKAFAALSSMAQWMTENRLTDILTRPQPAFSIMKKHYPHGFPGWSKKKDCLVELECMGRWPQAYAAISAEGVSDQAMLEHLLFTYQYAFAKLDARILPHGKTVKIVDLDGLSMSDLRTPGFKLITRVGAMLSMNFPQRLQRCFLINAPGWWAVAWKIISPIIPPKVRAQMTLFGKNDKEAAKKAMLEWIDEDVLPVAYGGKNELPLAECQFEVELAKYVAELNGKSAAVGDAAAELGGGSKGSQDLSSPFASAEDTSLEGEE